MQSYKDFDKSYRRGLVLGFSLAELFLILVFLLLLLGTAVSTIYIKTQEELDNAKQTIKTITNEDNEFTDTITTVDRALGENIITPEDIEDLIEGKKTSQEEKSEGDGLTTEEREEIVEKREEAVEEREIVVDKREESVKKREEAVENREEVVEEWEESVEKREEKIALLDKGQHPPCWYVLVSDSTKETGYREEHIRIYDVKITDDKFVVRKKDNSEIENLEQGETRHLPTINDSAFNRELTESEFLNIFRPLFNVGRNKKIHEYPCNFMADVYDFTSKDNKQGWQKNLRIVKGLFLEGVRYDRRDW